MNLRDDLRVGTELAGYWIEAYLGRGGMGVVYLAEDRRLKRKVALKLLSAVLAEDDAFRERFLHESELAASLDHPNVVPIYEAGEVDGLLFIAMRYVQGSDLRKRLRERPMTPETGVALLMQVAGALDAAHALGLVHGDVKPSNVLIAAGAGVDGSDHVYLADFGLTKRLSDDGGLAADGQLMATIDYVSPEQISGDPVDGRADVYSLGCLLYECLSGEPPYSRDSDVAVLFAHLDEEPPSLSERQPRLPRAIDPVVATAIAKAPGDRYETCRDLVDAARQALDIAAPARPRWARVPVLVGLVCLALVAAGLASYFAVRGGGDGQPLGRGDALVRIDPRTNEVVASISMRDEPAALAIAENGGVWVGNRRDSTVSHVDPGTNEVILTKSAQGSPADMASLDGRIVVANGPLDGNIAVLDVPGTGGDVLSLPAGFLDFGSARVSAGEAGVWVATPDRRVARLDVSRGLVDPVAIPPPTDERADSFFSAIAVGEDAVWVAGDPLDRTVWRIDPATAALAATIPLPFAPKDIAVAENAVWVTSQLQDTVSRIDPATNEITVTIQVGRGAAGVGVGAGSVWVANAVDGTVSRIDARTLEVETIDVEGRPDDVAVGAGAVWVTTYAL